MNEVKDIKDNNFKIWKTDLMLFLKTTKITYIFILVNFRIIFIDLFYILIRKYVLIRRVTKLEMSNINVLSLVVKNITHEL